MTSPSRPEQDEAVRLREAALSRPDPFTEPEANKAWNAGWNAGYVHALASPPPEQDEAVRLPANGGSHAEMEGAQGHDLWLSRTPASGDTLINAVTALLDLLPGTLGTDLAINRALNKVIRLAATPPPVPAAPLWRLQGEYVVDRDGLVWRVVRDGGMATRADFTGIESIGIEALRSTKGPLTSLNEFVDAAARLSHQSEDA